MRSNNIFLKLAALAAAFAIFAIIFSSCKIKRGSDETTTSEAAEVTERNVPAGVLTVPYTTLDSLNPFVTKSLLNSSLTSLVFRAL